MKVLIVSAQDWYVPSGMPQIIQQIIGGLLSRGIAVTTVLPKRSVGLDLYKPAKEYYDSPNGLLTVEWLPEFDFNFANRDRLLHHLETLIVKECVDRILAVGVRKAGFISSIAARLREKLFGIVLTYSDAFESHLNVPQELDVVTEAAKLLIAPNPLILEHLGCFYPLADRAFWLQTPPTILDSECFDAEEDLRYRDATAGGQTYLCTTGNINPLVDVAELLDRAVGLMRDGVADRWIHVGTVDPNTLMHLSNRLVLLGMSDHFALTGVVARSRYKCLIQGARVIVKPAGEVNTGIGAVEANAWQIPLSTPAEYPVLPLKPYLARPESESLHCSRSSRKARFNSVTVDVVLDRFLQ